MCDLRCVMMLAVALCLSMAAVVQGATMTVEASAQAVKRGDPLTVTCKVADRVEGDRVDHYMVWTQGQPVPNPLRVEGPNCIVADGNRTGVFDLDVSLWQDATYVLRLRAYYYASKDAVLQRIDGTVTVKVAGGAPPPMLQVKVDNEQVTAGQPLTLSLELQNGERYGELVETTLVNRGQQLTGTQEIPLDQAEVVLDTWKGPGKHSIDTTGWRGQVLRCLAVQARYRVAGQEQTTTWTGAVPRITVIAPGAATDPRLMMSYRGSRPIHLITNDAYMNSFPYPTCQSWRSNGREVFFESNRPRPDGTLVKGERQLMMADVETGKLTHLATLGVEDTSIYGEFHTGGSSQYHSDYAPGADLLVYYDMTGHHLYTLRPGGAPVEVLHETQGYIGDPPAISRDGTEILYYIIFPGPKQNRYFAGMTSAIFTLRIDPATGKAVGEPHMVYAYPWRKTPFTDAPRTANNWIGVNHVQFCPTDTNRIMYAHEGGYSRNGEPENNRVWHLRVDGSDNRSLAPAEEKGTYYTHEVYGPLGQYVYAVWGGSVARFEVDSGRFEAVYKMERPLVAGHIGVSPDEKWVAADMHAGFGLDNDGNPIGGLFLIETATGKATFLAAFPAGPGHPRHIHPNFSPDGTRVGFTMSDGRGGSQLAYVDVADLVRP